MSRHPSTIASPGTAEPLIRFIHHPFATVAPHPYLVAAQHAYMTLANERISQAVIQRLQGALEGGASIHDAAATAYAFFTRRIDWNAERELLADWEGKRCRGEIAATIVLAMS